MSDVPFYYDYINAENSQVNPSYIHASNTKLSRYYRRDLLQTAMSPYKITVPKWWNKDYFLYTLFCKGYIAVINTDRFGVIPQDCNLGGYDVFYGPAYATISNPLLKGNMRPRINVECSLIKLQPDYGGILDTVSYYADMMALCSESAAANTLAAKLAYVFAAGNKSSAESFKKMMDAVSSGEIAVVLDKALNDPATGTPTWQLFNTHLGETFIAPDLLDLIIRWKQRFCTEMGIPNTNTTKRERLTDDEVNSNNVETVARCAVWMDSLKDGFEKTRQMFGFTRDELNIEWRFPEMEVDTYESETVNNGAILR